MFKTINTTPFKDTPTYLLSLPVLATGALAGGIISSARGLNPIEGSLNGLRITTCGLSFISILGTSLSKGYTVAITASITALYEYDYKNLATVLGLSSAVVSNYYKKHLSRGEDTIPLLQEKSLDEHDPLVQAIQKGPSTFMNYIDEKDSISLAKLELALPFCKDEETSQILQAVIESHRSLNEHKSKQDTIFEKTTIQELRDSYKGSDSMRKKFEYPISQNISHYRNVKGDGNCYYRAIMFQFFEQAMNHPERMFYLNNLISQIEQSTMVSSKKEALITFLRQVTTNGSITTTEELEILFTPTDNDSFDFLIILAARHLISDFLLKNRNSALNQENSTSLEDSILISLSDSTSLNKTTNLKDYCENHILKMGEFADGDIPNANFLGRILGFNSSIFVITETTEAYKVTDKSVVPQINSNPIHINLIKSSCHYGILYEQTSSLDVIKNLFYSFKKT